MNENRIMDQIGAIFGTFMTIFYIGIGLYFIISPVFVNYDKVVLNIVGGTFLLYGIYRGYRSYLKIMDSFFSKGGRKKEFDNQN